MFLALTLAACGSSQTPNQSGTSSQNPAASAGANQADTYELGETVSTGIIDFTLNKATLAYYADSYNEMHPDTGLVTAQTIERFAMPEDEPNGDYDFTANKGRVLVCLEFVIKNNDRGLIDIGSSFSDWLSDDFNIVYGGESFMVKGYDLGNPDGDSFGFKLNNAITSLSAGDKWIYNSAMNYLLDAGEELTVRTVGIASFDPSSLDDSFQFNVDVLNSAKETEQFTYNIG